jgi:multidrug transporter EmrE-like cation transporter
MQQMEITTGRTGGNPPGIVRMSAAGLAQLGISTVIFMFAAAAAKSWTLAPSNVRLVLVLALYTAGNLIMLRLIREFGMGVALSLSGVIQLAAVNLVAFAWFGERVNLVQGTGIVVALAAIALITIGPYISPR